MHIALVIHAITPGGAERVMTLMANYWAGNGSRVTLFTFDDGRKAPHYPIAKDIEWHALNLERETTNVLSATASNMRRWRILRRAICQCRPNAVIAFLEQQNILSVLATRGTRIPIIISERNHPSLYRIPRSWLLLRPLIYPMADQIIFQTEQVRSLFAPTVQRKSVVIPNPVIVSDARPRQVGKPSCGRKKRIIGVGRLTRQKGFDLLIESFSRIAGRHPQWEMVITGDGPCRAELQKLIHAHKLESRVSLPGVTQAIFAELAEADLFVLPSRFEGFPNALCEAMACGLPVISADCPFGPGEIIRDGVDGVLVAPENVNALAEAMDRLISNEDHRNRIAARAPEVSERFAIAKIMKRWNEVVDRVVTAP